MFDTELMGLIDDEEDEAETLGPCGCTDYHMADCPTVNWYGYNEEEVAEMLGDYGEADDRWWEE